MTDYIISGGERNENSLVMHTLNNTFIEVKFEKLVDRTVKLSGETVTFSDHMGLLTKVKIGERSFTIYYHSLDATNNHVSAAAKHDKSKYFKEEITLCINKNIKLLGYPDFVVLGEFPKHTNSKDSAEIHYENNMCLESKLKKPGEISPDCCKVLVQKENERNKNLLLGKCDTQMQSHANQRIVNLIERTNYVAKKIAVRINTEPSIEAENSLFIVPKLPTTPVYDALIKQFSNLSTKDAIYDKYAEYCMAGDNSNSSKRSMIAFANQGKEYLKKRADMFVSTMNHATKINRQLIIRLHNNCWIFCVHWPNAIQTGKSLFEALKQSLNDLLLYGNLPEVIVIMGDTNIRNDKQLNQSITVDEDTYIVQELTKNVGNTNAKLTKRYDRVYVLKRSKKTIADNNVSSKREKNYSPVDMQMHAIHSQGQKRRKEN